MDASVAYARKRDPVGDRFHVAFACIYLACAGIATSAEAISFALLVVYAFARGHALWRAWMPLMTSRLLWGLAAWVAWELLSLAWSPDRAAGLEMLGGTRGALLLLALFPIRDRWRLLLGGLFAGLAVQCLIQFGQTLDLIPIDNRNPFRRSGLYSHPGHLCTFYGVAMVLATAWFRDVTRTRERALLLALLVAYGAGIGVAAGRGAMVALAVALPLTIALVIGFHGIGPLRGARTIRLGVLAALAISAIVALTGGTGLWMMLGDLLRVQDVGSSSGSRLVYWSAALDTFADRPVAGVGVGGTRTAFLTNPDVLDAAAQRPDLGIGYFAHHHPHSLYFQALAEGGVVGGLLLTLAIAATLRAAWSRCREAAVWCGMFAAIVLWLVAAGFEALHVSGRMASLACVLLAFVVCTTGDRFGTRRDPSAREPPTGGR